MSPLHALYGTILGNVGLLKKVLFDQMNSFRSSSNVNVHTFTTNGHSGNQNNVI